MAALMEHATPEIAPCFALGAFAGLRSEEILRLEWADVTVGQALSRWLRINRKRLHAD
jgi:hypothetical protein